MLNQNRKNKIYVVGLGPGDSGQMTYEAVKAIQESDAVIGYKNYISWIKELLVEKKVVTTGMRQEISRCQEALYLYKTGLSVAVVSGGDAGIYGMAGLVLELAAKDNLAPEVEVLPGISAFNAASALLGAPLMHDFCAVSLSDLLTERNVIEKRLDLSAQAGFIIAIYNPKSNGRQKQIVRAVDIILQHRDKDTPVGIVKNAYREGQQVLTASLGDIPYGMIDMNTVLIIGNERTKILDGKMVTPRGYEL